MLNQTSNVPRANTYWFRDWFYPVYRDHGETRVLADFFRLLSEHFPKDGNRKYTRSMNWGEFVHFFSGAARTNLKARATNAFGWTTEMEREFVRARTEFPAITY